LEQAQGIIKRKWQTLEKHVFRGVRPRSERINATDREAIISLLNESLKPLMVLENKASAESWATALWHVAEKLYAHEALSTNLWAVMGGTEAQSVLQSLIDYGHNLPDISPRGMSKLLAVLMRGKVVRPPFGTHPRLSILGPLEARMLSADVVILGGLNEGVWPATPKIEPFLSRSMRQAVGLSLPEKRFGLSAHDFAELAANPNVILTRSKRSGGSPMVASRWLWRLTTLLEGALGEKKAAELLGVKNDYLKWTQALDHIDPKEVRPAEAPQPNPKKEDRWAFRNGRSVSITQVKTWIRDPYSIFARHALGLKPLEALDMPLGAGQFGSAIHDGLEQFLKGVLEDEGHRCEEKLVQAFRSAFLKAGYLPFEISKEESRFSSIAKDFLAWVDKRKFEGFDVHAIESEAVFKIEPLDFTLTGKADLIEYRPDGYGVIDYKTGAPTSVKVVKAGFDPQLPLTAWLISQGAFNGVSKGDTVQMGYVRVKGSNDDFFHRHLTPPEEKNGLSGEEFAAQAFSDLCELIKSYDKKGTAYYSQPRVQYTHDFGEFDDLARRSEWAALGRDFGSGVMS
jgi:ATP-dependent helicase/nuclease subunit B